MTHWNQTKAPSATYLNELSDGKIGHISGREALLAKGEFIKRFHKKADRNNLEDCYAVLDILAEMRSVWAEAALAEAKREELWEKTKNKHITGWTNCGDASFQDIGENY